MRHLNVTVRFSNVLRAEQVQSRAEGAVGVYMQTTNVNAENPTGKFKSEKADQHVGP